MRTPATERSKVSLVFLVLLFLFWTWEADGQATGEAPQPVESPSAVSQPQSTRESNSGTKQFFQALWSDQEAILTSPFRMDGGQAVTIALPLVAGTAGLIAMDRDAAKWLPNTPDQVKWSKRASEIGAIYTLGGVVGGLMLAGKKKDDPEIFNTGRASARALISTQ